MLLKPIISWLHIIEGDEPRISSACTAFAEIRRHMLTVLNTNFLSNEYNKILEDRYVFCIKPFHYAANLLDPTKHEVELTPTELLKAQEYLRTPAEF